MYKIIEHARGIKLIEFYNQNNFHVILSNYGASIYEIDMVDKVGESEIITLSPQSPYYFRNTKYFGLTVGRVIGRIKDASFEIGNNKYKIRPNENNNLLHSGDETFAYKLFDFYIDDSEEETKVTYTKNILDMEDGFPGDAEIKIVYTLKKKVDQIKLEFFAYSNKDTFFNISNHTYFNLSGNLKRTIEDEYLTINKNYISIMDDDLILLYNEPVKKEFDFRKPKKIGTHISEDSVKFPNNGYDNCYTDNKPVRIELFDEESGRCLNIESDYKDVVIYTNNQSTNTQLISDSIDKEYLGIAIEPSRLTDTMKKEGPLQKARTLYSHQITYKFFIKEK